MYAKCPNCKNSVEQVPPPRKDSQTLFFCKYCDEYKEEVIVKTEIFEDN